MKIFLVLALAFIAVSQTVNALKCYECGPGRVSCSSKKEDWNKKECDIAQCLKIDVVDKDGKDVIARSCAMEKGHKDDCETRDEGGKKGKACYCSNEDLCNGAFTAQASIVGTILLVAFSLFLSN